MIEVFKIIKQNYDSCCIRITTQLLQCHKR